jgi:hypothetical protein
MRNFFREALGFGVGFVLGGILSAAIAFLVMYSLSRFDRCDITGTCGNGVPLMIFTCAMGAGFLGAWFAGRRRRPE